MKVPIGVTEEEVTMCNINLSRSDLVRLYHLLSAIGTGYHKKEMSEDHEEIRIKLLDAVDDAVDEVI